MNKKEIEEYLKRIDELGAKLTGKDKETYAWLIYCCNQCAKWLNEKEQQCQKQKEVIDKVKFAIKTNCIKNDKKYEEICCDGDYLLQILEDKEVE